MKVFLCEKPSQAKDISAVLGGAKKNDGFFETDKGIVTYCFGHLLQLQAPEDYDEKFKKWGFESLPIVPDQWKVKPSEGKAKQIKTIKGLCAKASEVVIATDPDREGEAIARQLLTFIGYKGPLSRLWLSSLDEKSIAKALNGIKPGKETEKLALAAYARGRGDWLVGMNLTRAATSAFSSDSGVLSVGRVQTPTLSLVVKRDAEIAGFTPKTYYEVVANVSGVGSTAALRHTRSTDPDERIYNKEEAEALANEAAGKQLPLNVERAPKKGYAPKLFSLSSLQKVANAKFGWTADKTLKIAQKLYEEHKATSYPRSDCEFIPKEQIDDIRPILDNLSDLEELSEACAAASPPFIGASFNTEKVTAHHAIIPTLKKTNLIDLDEDCRKAFILISRRYIANVLPPQEYVETVLTMNVGETMYKATGRVIIAKGWTIVLPDKSDKDVVGLPDWTDQTMVTIDSADADEKVTSPPKPYTEGTLISDMKAVAKFVTDPDVKKRLKETSGIGTEATRGSVLETLKNRKYITPNGKTIVSTDAGRAIIGAIPPRLSDVGETALWEEKFAAIEDGSLSVDGFVSALAKEVTDHVETIKGMASSSSIETGTGRGNKPTPKMLKLAEMLSDRFGEPLPKEAKSSFDDCQKFITGFAGKDMPAAAPSEKQIFFAKEIAKASGVELPKEAQEDRAELSKWIDANKASAPKKPPSAKQIGFAEKLAKEKKLEIPENLKSDWKVCSDFIEAALKKK